MKSFTSVGTSRAVSRRTFLRRGARGAVALSPAAYLFDAFVRDLLLGASAEAAGAVTERSFVNLNMGGGPPRYMFDHWLRTRDDEPALVVSPYNANAFVHDAAGRVSGTEERLFRFREHLVPHLFSTFEAAERERFLDGFLVVRGYGSGIDGHGLNSQLQQHPLSSAPSISGHVADHSGRIFQAVRMDGGGRFLSAKGISINDVHRANPLGSLLGALLADGPTRRLSQTYGEAFDEVRAALGALPSRSTAQRIAVGNLERSHSLLESSLRDFEEQWPLLVAKYEAAIGPALRDLRVPGISVSLDGAMDLSFEVDESDPRFDSGVGSVGYLSAGANVCRLAEHATVGLADKLALAEYGIKNRLVSAFELQVGNVRNLNASAGGGRSLFDLGNDMHGGGGYVVFPAMTMFHRATVAGLLLFSRELEAAGQWSNTLVRLSSEFDRKISVRGTGSGHGTEQMITSVFSGAFTGGPYVVGNVAGPSPESGIATQGVALPIENYSVAHRPTPIMVASTLNALLGIEHNPWRNFQAPLVGLRADRTLELPFGAGRMIPV